MSNKILIVFAHPAYHKSRVNKALLKGVGDLDYVTINNLYENYPDFFIDIKREQELLFNHDIIIWHHPFYWYSAPAILKEWFDLVLEHNIAFGKNGNALKGKYAFNSITTGGSKDAYSATGRNVYPLTQYILPYKQAACLCKMNYLPPFVVHGTHLLSDDSLKGHVSGYRHVLALLKNQIPSEDIISSIEYLNDLLMIGNK